MPHLHKEPALSSLHLLLMKPVLVLASPGPGALNPPPSEFFPSLALTTGIPSGLPLTAPSLLLPSVLREGISWVTDSTLSPCSLGNLSVPLYINDPKVYFQPTAAPKQTLRPYNCLT